MCLFRKQRINLLDGFDCSFQGTAVIIAVEGIEQGTILAHQCDLGGGGAGINTQIAVPLIGCQICGYHMVAAVSGSKNIISLFIFK